MARYNRPTTVSSMSVNPKENKENMSTDTTEAEATEEDFTNDPEFGALPEAEDTITPEGSATELEDDEDSDEDFEDSDSDSDSDEDDEDDDDSAEDKAAAEEAARKQAEELATKFANQVDEVIAESQTAESGQLESELIAKIVALYQGVPGVRAKGLCRIEIETAMYACVTGDNLPLAKVYMNLAPELKAAAPTKASKVVRTLTPEEQFLYWGKQIASLDLARQLVVIPEEVASLEKSERIQEIGEQMYNEYYQHAVEYIAYLRDEGPVDPDTDKPIEPEAPDFVKNAAKLALGKGIGSRKAKKAGGSAKNSGPRAPRRAPRTHIEQVFMDLPVGTFLKVGEIASAKSDEYGDDNPSQGAIASNLNNENFQTSWIEIQEVDGFMGARKIAEAS